ncbi:hypothetical protein [Pseudoxanthomonas kaohsiungensis]|uniref:Uncharacterized protein n=1 Tax=Pseudoxanthomonas kaohsiungensis TaxID=283923 RepID=A0ABW3M0L3_9GAMM|nr:hypothetical protein [Pseudoxanthomonas kaohsiungensis]
MPSLGGVQRAVLCVGSISEESTSAFVALPVGSESGAGRFLHMVPELTLFRTSLMDVGAIRAAQAGLQISVGGRTWSTDRGEIRIRRLYPNRGYLVAGIGDRKHGVALSLPIGMDHVSVVYRWALPEWGGMRKIEHQLDVVLGQGGDGTSWYTTQASFWSRLPSSDMSVKVTPLELGPRTHLRHLRSSYGEARTVCVSTEDGVAVVREQICLPPQASDRVARLRQFEF